MRQVTQSEFYAHIGPLDVEVQIRGRYTDPDYGTDFVLKSYPYTLVGRTVPTGPNENYKPIRNYFLP